MMTIPSKTFKDINLFLNENINYTKLSIMEQNLFIKKFNNIIFKYGIDITPFQMLDIRNTFIYLLSKTKGTMAHRLGDDIMLDYKNNISIMNISKKYNLPPMSIIYQILIELKNESHKIDKIIKKQLLPDNIQIQMSEIIKNDPMFWFSRNIPNIHEKLNKLKCKYTLKYDLQKKGKCPDILFFEPCSYKNKKFSWIIFKPYVIFNNNLHLHDIQKNINNFQRFGTGLILYTDVLCSKSFIKKINANIDTYNFLD